MRFAQSDLLSKTLYPKLSELTVSLSVCKYQGEEEEDKGEEGTGLWAGGRERIGELQACFGVFRLRFIFLYILMCSPHTTVFKKKCCICVFIKSHTCKHFEKKWFQSWWLSQIQ